jgi:hypothetical protein
MPHVKEIEVVQRGRPDGWFVPGAFSTSNLRHFAAFTNVKTLTIQRLNINHFLPGVEHYFEQFAPTLQSIALHYPVYAAPKQLGYFLSLFQSLDDVDVRQPSVSNAHTFNGQLVPFSSPRLRGRLTVYKSRSIDTWTYLMATCRGLRFRHMDLYETSDAAPILLEACAGTLESFRFYATDDPGEQSADFSGVN